MDLLRRRLFTQHMAGVPLEEPADVVNWLGAVQSQDYPGAKWSVGQRVKNCSDAAVDQAFSSGRILRTHVLRPTWHFVTPDDIRWLLQLTAPHVHALNAYYYRKLELSAPLFVRSHKVLGKALAGGQARTRSQLAAMLAKSGIVADKLRLAYIMMHAELDELVCSGPLRGKQHTYMLLEERAPNARRLDRAAALAELARRFFTSHGPATLRHFVWWSGLSVAAANAGLEAVKRHLTSVAIAGTTFWARDAQPAAKEKGTTAYLVPEYDELLIGSKDLSVPDLPPAKRLGVWSDSFFRPVIIDAKRAGTWRRSITKDTAVIETNLFASLNAVQARALTAAAKRYGTFLGMPVVLMPRPNAG